MSREDDLRWYSEHREELADAYSGQWLVIVDSAVVKSLATEVEAIEFSVDGFGIDVASVLQATKQDPVIFVG